MTSSMRALLFGLLLIAITCALPPITRISRFDPEQLMTDVYRLSNSRAFMDSRHVPMSEGVYNHLIHEFELFEPADHVEDPNIDISPDNLADLFADLSPEPLHIEPNHESSNTNK